MRVETTTMEHFTTTQDRCSKRKEGIFPWDFCDGFSDSILARTPTVITARPTIELSDSWAGEIWSDKTLSTTRDSTSSPWTRAARWITTWTMGTSKATMTTATITAIPGRTDPSRILALTTRARARKLYHSLQWATVRVLTTGSATEEQVSQPHRSPNSATAASCLSIPPPHTNPNSVVFQN